MIAPWSVEAPASTVVFCPTLTVLGVAVALITGGRLPTVSACVAVAVAPPLLATRKPMLYSPALARLVVNVGDVPVSVSYVPSPLRSQR